MAKSQNKEEYLDKLDDDRRINCELGKNLHKSRLHGKAPKKEAFTFEWLSNVTALHHSSIRKFEKGESGMTVANLVRLKDALGCSWNDLLEGCESTIVKERKSFYKK